MSVFVAGGLYIWVVIILLNEDNWIAISTITTLLLAIAAFWTIRQNYRFREKDSKKRMLEEIIKWVSDLKLTILQTDAQASMLKRKQRYDRIFLAISNALLNAELMSLLATKYYIPVEKELNDVWQSAFFCSQLAARINGNKPTGEQRKKWGKDALDIVNRIDQLEEQGKLTDQEMYDGQKDLLRKVSICLRKLVEVETTL